VFAITLSFSVSFKCCAMVQSSVVASTCGCKEPCFHDDASASAIWYRQHLTSAVTAPLVLLSAPFHSYYWVASCSGSTLSLPMECDKWQMSFSQLLVTSEKLGHRHLHSFPSYHYTGMLFKFDTIK
jgi:hypothetical protein